MSYLIIMIYAMKSARSDKWICKEDMIYVPSQIGKTAKYKTRIEE